MQCASCPAAALSKDCRPDKTQKRRGHCRPNRSSDRCGPGRQQGTGRLPGAHRLVAWRWGRGHILQRRRRRHVVEAEAGIDVAQQHGRRPRQPSNRCGRSSGHRLCLLWPACDDRCRGRGRPRGRRLAALARRLAGGGLLAGEGAATTARAAAGGDAAWCRAGRGGGLSRGACLGTGAPLIGCRRQTTRRAAAACGETAAGTSGGWSACRELRPQGQQKRGGNTTQTALATQPNSHSGASGNANRLSNAPKQPQRRESLQSSPRRSTHSLVPLGRVGVASS